MGTTVVEAPDVAVDAQPPAERIDRPRHWALITLPVSALALAVGAFGATDRHLWQDEYITAYAARLPWSDLGRLLRQIDLVHAFYYAVLHFWIDVFGASPLALRAPSVIGIAVAAGALVVLGRRLVDDLTGVFAGVLFAIVPAVSRYAQEARSYAWVTALALLSTLALTSALRDPRRRRWVLYGAALVALTYLHFVALLIVLPHALLVRRAGRKAWLITTGVAGALAVPLGVLASGQADQIAWIGRTGKKAAEFPTTLFGGHGVAWAMMIVALYGAVALAQQHRATVFPLLVWAFAPPLVCYAVYPLVHIFLAKYVLFTLPAWALLCAAAVVVPLAPPSRRLVTYRWFALPVAALAVLALGWSQQRVVRGPDMPGEPDFHSPAVFIDGQAQAGDGIAYSGPAGRTARMPFAFELHRSHPRDVFLKESAASNGSYGAIECTDPAPCVGDLQRLWVVSTEAPAADPLRDMPAERKRLLLGEFSIAGTTKFSHVQVLLLLRHPVEG